MGRRRQVLKECTGTFVAIDFETADYEMDSACAVAIVRVERWEIVQREVRLIRPPRNRFDFTYVHGITWEHVKHEQPFASVWPHILPKLAEAEFLAAHNASFDRSVLHMCCRAAQQEPPALTFQCTMQLARRAWGIYPTKLPNVCARLGLALKHHDPASDAEACARILIAGKSFLTAGPAAAPVEV